MSLPKLINGGIAKDKRGSVSFINLLDLKKFVRFYFVKNKKKNVVRAWHGHLKESKIIICIEGRAKICAVKLTNRFKPSKNKKIYKWLLDANKSFSCIYIPKGYANGTVSLDSKMKLLVFSDLSLKQSLKDDYRFEKNYWRI